VSLPINPNLYSPAFGRAIIERMVKKDQCLSHQTEWDPAQYRRRLEHQLSSISEARDLISEYLGISQERICIGAEDLGPLRETALRIFDDTAQLLSKERVAENKWAAFKRSLVGFFQYFFAWANFGVHTAHTRALNRLNGPLGLGHWEVIKIPGDGNCMLSSLFCAIEGRAYESAPTKAEKYRLMREFADYLRNLFALGILAHWNAGTADELRPSPPQEPSPPQGDEDDLVVVAPQDAERAGTPAAAGSIDPSRARDLGNFGENLTILELALLAKFHSRAIAVIEYRNGEYVPILLESDGSIRCNSQMGGVSEASPLDRIAFLTAAHMAGGAIFCAGGHARWARYQLPSLPTNSEEIGRVLQRIRREFGEGRSGTDTD
jgi:hypothetical protein